MTYACRDCDTTFTAPTDTDTVRCPGCGDMVEQQPAASPPPDQTLRDRIAEAIRAAACTGDCGDSEEECFSKRIQAAAWHHGVLAEVLGNPETIADAVMPVLQSLTLRELELLARPNTPPSRPEPRIPDHTVNEAEAPAPVRQRADCTELEWAEQERARFERLYTRESVRADLAEQRADTAARDADIYQQRLERLGEGYTRERKRADEAEAHRLALSEALGLGTGAPWDAIHDRATELGLPPLAEDPVAQRLGLVPAPADRAAVLNAAAQHLYTALFPAVYADMGQKAAEGVNRAVTELRRLAAEAQQERSDVGTEFVRQVDAPDEAGLAAFEADLAAEAQQLDTERRPRRGDQFEAWLKAQRDAAADYPEAYQATDGLLDLYRLHADTGTPLDQHACEGQHCDCPAATEPDPQPVSDEFLQHLATAKVREDDGAEAQQQPATCRNCRGSGLDPRYNGEYACPDCSAEAPQPEEEAELVCVDECGFCDACGMEPFGTPAEGWREAARFLRRTPRDSTDFPGALRGARLIEDELRRRAEAQQPDTAHSCRNCEGIDPDTCLMNPHRPAVTVHAVPLPGSNGISSCCGRPPCEFVGERVTRDPEKVTCPGPAVPVQPAAADTRGEADRG
jgi:DNA-directed RNA polymerase subunit RPC12/RpoP